MSLESIVVGAMNLLGDGIYSSLRKYGLTHNRAWLIGRSDLYRFSIGKLAKHVEDFTEVAEIKKGFYEYDYFNICFLNDMLSMIVRAIAEKKIPQIELINSKGENLWELFFEQPFCEIDISKKVRVEAKEDTTRPFPAFDEVFSERSIQLWGSMYQKFVRFNPATWEYISKELKEILGDKGRVLGVLCRGTDYTECKPKGHPVQPEIADVMDLAEKKMRELHCDYIYLATEDGKIDNMFRERFPDKILTNQRVYYDEIFKNNRLTWIKDVHFERENDDYLKGIEYLSSLTILSKCTALIAGNCGGSQAAVFMNKGAYEETHIFNLGIYE